MLLLLRSNPSRQHSKGTTLLGGQKRRKDSKSRNGKWWVFAQPPYSLQGNEVVTQGGTI